MNSPFISALVYRKYINLLSKMVDLPTTIQISLDGKEQKEHTIFHRMFLENYGATDGIFKPCLKVTGFIVTRQGDLPDSPDLMLIDPEIEFNKNHEFWAGAPVKLFNDYMPMADKKYGKLSMCASYDRDLAYPTFMINETMPIIESSYPLSVLDLLEASESSKPRPLFVGTVDEDGNVTPPSTTLNDGPIDTPPANAVPSFLTK